MEKLELGKKIARLNDLLISSQNEWGKEIGISNKDYNIFLTLQENPGCTNLFLAKKRQVERSFITKIIKKYIDMGYIERQTSQTNKSAYALYLTETGQDITESIRVKIKELDTQLSELYTAEQNKNFNHLLDLAIKEMETHL